MGKSPSDSGMTGHGLSREPAVPIAISRMKTPPSFSLRYFFLVLCGLLLIGLLTWKTTEEMTALTPPAAVIPAPVPAAVLNNQKAVRDPGTGSNRPLEIEVPIAGNIRGVGWIKLHPPEPNELRIQAVDVLVNEHGLALMVRHGDEAYATRPNQQAYQEFLPRFFLGSREHHPIKYVRICPLPVDDPALGEKIRGTFANSPATMLRTWIPLEFEYEKDLDGRQVRRGVLHISTTGRIWEEMLHTSYRLPIFTPDPGLYVPPVVPGANLFGTLVDLRFREIPLPWENNPNLDRMESRVYIHESWAGAAPWRDEQLDPIHGEYRIDELSIPSDHLTRADENIHDVQADEKRMTFKPRPEAEARRAARLAQEAAEKSASAK